jgi:hypothetical protein
MKNHWLARHEERHNSVVIDVCGPEFNSIVSDVCAEIDKQILEDLNYLRVYVQPFTAAQGDMFSFTYTLSL